MDSPRPRLFAGLAAYALLGLLAALTLDDWRIRGAVVILLAAFAVKTWIGTRTRR